MILSAIEYLLEKKILVEGAKLTKDKVLLNQYRREIYDFIYNNIGVNFSTIKKEVYGEIGSSGQLIWHLQMLLKFNFIKKIKYKKFSIFIPIEIREEIGIYYYLLRDDITQKIIRLLINRGAAEKSEINVWLEARRDSIYYRINNLIEVKVLIEKFANSKEVLLAPDKRELMIHILNRLVNIKGE